MIKLIKHYTMKTYVGFDIEIHVFLTSATVIGERSAQPPGRFNPQGNSPRYPLYRRLGGCLRAGLDDVEKVLDSTGTRTPIPYSSIP
jgi:hypothetical protein